MESDNSSVDAPKSPPVDYKSPATEQTPPIELKKTPETSPDKGAAASNPASPPSDKIQPEKASFATTMASTAYTGGSEANSFIKDATLDDDTANDDNLSPPPESMSGISDMAVNEDQDEIVVGSANNGGTPKTDAAPVPLEKEGSTAMDIDREEDVVDQPTSTYPKRKRSYVFGDLTEDKMNKSLLADETDDEASPVPGPVPVTRSGKTPRTTHGLASVKGVTIGYWRESKAPIGDKHIVKGFIDSRDRLRTRVQPCNREGKVVTDLYPLNPGPGGSWVTFEKIVFDNHLVHLDQTQVKEYVKIRSDMDDPEYDSIANDTAAVQQAIARCKARGGQLEGVQPPQIAYGVDIPDHALHRPEKRRRTGGSSAHATPVAKNTNTQGHPPVADLHGTRPTKILLGFWKGSAEPEDKDKHAVFGILGNNDMFRVKVGRETRDGRPLQSNFPSGAGALWLSFDEYQIEDYLEGLTRLELKEYCRVRQFQMDHGEKPEEKDQNRKTAIDEARARVAAGFTKPEPREHPLPSNANGNLGEGPYTETVLKHEAPTHETRHQAHARRSLPTLVPNQARQSTQPPEFRAANRSVGVDSRTNNLAANAVARVEARQTKNDQREAAYRARQSTEGDADGDGDGHSGFQDNVSRLNRVWIAQETQRIRANKEDAKMHMGIKYERKQTGPFEGKLVSQGTIISIDGEDYVEYRVLTKPTFF